MFMMKDTMVRLAIAIAVVGSHRTEFFEAVFGIMLDWQVGTIAAFFINVIYNQR
jgi:hypothetical protein